MTTADKRASFRRMHDGGFFVLPNAWDVGSAVRLADAGFRAIGSTSVGAAWAAGRQDGELGVEAVLDDLRMLVTATSLPVNADFENGFADRPDEVAHKVALAVETGIAAVSIEDWSGSTMYETGLAQERIRTARAAIDAVDAVMLVGRNENFQVPGMSVTESIERAVAYAEAGADCLFVPFVSDRGAVAELVAAVAPKPVNVVVHDYDDRIRASPRSASGAAASAGASPAGHGRRSTRRSAASRPVRLRRGGAVPRNDVPARQDQSAGSLTASAAAEERAARRATGGGAMAHAAGRGSAVLLHGGWGDPEDWRWVRRLLEDDGVHVVTPDLPSHRGSTAGLREDAETVRAAVRACPPPVVVVGWSYGGGVITAAADGERDVVGLVYVGSVPREEGFVEGDAWLDDNEHVTHFPDGTHVLDDRWWREEDAGSTFPSEVRDALRDHPRRRATRRSFADAQLGEAWRGIRSTVLMGRDDGFLTEWDLEWLRAHPDLDLRLLDGDHFVLFRDPGVVAGAVVELLRRRG